MPYDYGALDPVISGQIMEIHHKKHHQAYVNNLNIALEKYADAEAKGDYEAMIGLQPAIKFNGFVPLMF
jgi:superoxide dismutase, Fe-Mn family